MSADVCVCGHLEQAHRRADEGDCRAPTCVCTEFVSEDDDAEEAA